MRIRVSDHHSHICTIYLSDDTKGLTNHVWEQVKGNVDGFGKQSVITCTTG